MGSVECVFLYGVRCVKQKQVTDQTDREHEFQDAVVLERADKQLSGQELNQHGRRRY